MRGAWSTGRPISAVAVTAANVQDRDATVPLLDRLRRLYFSVRLVWADGGYAGRLVDWAADLGRRGDRSERAGPGRHSASARSAAQALLLRPARLGGRRLCGAPGRLGGRSRPSR